MRQARPSRPTARSPQRSARCPTSGETITPNSASDDISVPTCPAVILRVVFMAGMMGGRNWSESAKATVRAYPATRYNSFLFMGLLFGNCESLGVRHHGIHNLRLSGFLQRHEADGISEFVYAAAFADDLGQILRVPGDTTRQSVDAVVEHEHGEGGRRADEDDPCVAGEFQEAWQALVGERRAGDRDDVQMREEVLLGLLGQIAFLWSLLEDGQTARGGTDLVGPWEVSDEADLLAGRFLEQQVAPVGLLGAREAGSDVAGRADGCHADCRVSPVPGQRELGQLHEWFAAQVEGRAVTARERRP